jgi:pimeloyl-ACP methyl ester carboxylesterase
LVNPVVSSVSLRAEILRNDGVTNLVGDERGVRVPFLFRYAFVRVRTRFPRPRAMGPALCVPRRREVRTMFFTSRGYNLHYEVVGSGRPLVLLHGLPMWGDRWRELGYVDRLSAEFMVVTPDLLGHGESDKPSDSLAYGIPNMAADVVTLLDTLGQDAAHVWGYSMGAWVAEAVAVLYPERVVSLTFGGNAPGQSAELRALVGQPLAEAAERGDWDAILVAGLAEDARQTYLRKNDLAAIRASASRFNDWGCTTDELKATDIPTLVYVGSREWFIDFAADAAQAAGARFVTLPGDHREAFARADHATDVVVPHLQSHRA